jgi:hypothetical protein
VKAALVATALALSFASPICAQALPPNAVVPPQDVIASVRSKGLDPSSKPVLRGRVYVLRAFDSTQFEKRVVVDARSGKVLSVHDALDRTKAYTPYDTRFGGYTPPRPPAAIAHVEPEFEPLLDAPLFPRSTRSASGSGSTTPDQRQEALSSRTPLPKGRPDAVAIATPPTAPSPTPTATPMPTVTAGASGSSPAAMPSAAALAAASDSPGKSIPAPHMKAAAQTDSSPTQFVPGAPLE